jgi:putative protease
MHQTRTDSRCETSELLAPAGNWECARAAVANGADAIYFGLPRFNARLRADNFTEEDLPELMNFLHSHGVRGFVAFNTLLFTDELEAAGEQLRKLNDADVDAVIVQDLGLAKMAAKMTPGLAVHASTQMTVTSPEGVEFVRKLGMRRVVLAREVSLRDLERFSPPDVMPLEVFVHGALCVAYSGQCLTSESLGQRSANRGECAQACRMPYTLIVDGREVDLGDKRYLLSPQDLAAVNEIPALLNAGVVSFKIEGRLKSPEYVAAVTQVYRRAIDEALAKREYAVTAGERYQLEMVFSRGLYSGWLHGVNHQELVPARFGKKRGPLAGRLTRVGRDFVEVDGDLPLKPGDGVVFDTGGDTENEQGGRIFQVRNRRLFFRYGHIDFSRLKKGNRVWKTDDPALSQKLRRTFSGRIDKGSNGVVALEISVSGAPGGPLLVEANCGNTRVQVQSSLCLEPARTAPLGEMRLREQFGKLGGTRYVLKTLSGNFEGDVILPIGEINRVRRQLVRKLDDALETKRPATDVSVVDLMRPNAVCNEDSTARLSVLCRSTSQIAVALENGVTAIYADFEDVRRYRDAVAMVRQTPGCEIALATPRIQKAGEQGFFRLIENIEPDGVLIRNLGAIAFFRDCPFQRIGDFSLNVANPIAARVLVENGLDRLTVSYDLNIAQVLALLDHSEASWFELTVHQHMPMFHMEHCVFAAFMSDGTDYTNCGRPCEKHRVHLRDRVGSDHPLRADVGCRNTLFNAVPQSGAQFFDKLKSAGLRRYRIELLEESPEETQRVIRAYRDLMEARIDARTLWRQLKAISQLGVTRGTY